MNKSSNTYARMPPLARWVFAAGGSIFLLLILSYHGWFGSSSRPLNTSSYPNSSLLSHIQNQTLGFERIYAIGLPQRTDRRDNTLLAATFTDLKLEFADGVEGKNLIDKQFPPGWKPGLLNNGQTGCWRAHLNIYHKMIQEGISSALIIEDDADWDIRLKDQMTQFALATRLLSQPLASNPASYADPTYPNSHDSSAPVELELRKSPAVQEPRHSPYGDNWDLLWLGHCATRFPEAGRDAVQRGRVLIKDDQTVPQWQHWRAGYGSVEIKSLYPNHTRVVHHSAENACTLGYAITQKAARQMLYQFGVMQIDGPIDMLMRKYCDGLEGRKVRNCYTSTPQYFEHFRPRGDQSGISDIDTFGGWNEHQGSANIRLSARVNLERLADGDSDLVDQYPNEY